MSYSPARFWRAYHRLKRLLDDAVELHGRDHVRALVDVVVSAPLQAVGSDDQELVRLARDLAAALAESRASLEEPAGSGETGGTASDCESDRRHLAELIEGFVTPR